MGSKNNKPKIRFNDFLDDWQQRKLRDIAIEILAGGDINKSKIVESGKYPIYANALTNDGIVGYYNDYFRVKAPAVTVTGRGDVGYAKARTVDFTPVVRLLTIRSNHDLYFLENNINNQKIVVESTGVPQLTVPQLAGYNISFPINMDEEIKIGEFFHSLDNLISLHQRKLDNLETLKKIFLDKLFPKNKETKPLYRFKGFNYDWKPCNFDDIFLSYPNKEYQIQSTEYNKSGKYPVIDQGKTAIIGYNDKIEKVCYQIPSIIFGDHTTELKYVEFPFIVGADGVKTLIVRNNYSLFQYYNLVKNKIKPTGYKRHFSILRDILLSSTEMDEQIQIGNFFKHLDTIITLHQQKLEHLEYFKKYFLNNMFI